MLNLHDLLSRKLLMVSGKGGTGKTVVSAALAIKAAASGRKVLLVENAVSEQLSPLFAQRKVGHEEVSLKPGIWGINLDPRLCFKEYVVDYLGLQQLYKRVFDQRIVKSFLAAIPGLGETMILGRLFHTCVLRQPSPYDLVIFDAPAFGHFYNLLTTPDAVIDSGIMGPLAKEVRRIKSFLADAQRCGCLVLTMAEELIISETLEFLPRLAQDACTAILGVLVNRYWEEASLQGRELAARKQSCPEAKAALDYLLHQVDKKLAGQQALRQGLAALPWSLPWGVLADMGQVGEPLTASFVDRLFAAIAEQRF